MCGINASKRQCHKVAIILKNWGFGRTFRALEAQCTSSWPEIEETSTRFWGKAIKK